MKTITTILALLLTACGVDPSVTVPGSVAGDVTSAAAPSESPKQGQQGERGPSGAAGPAGPAGRDGRDGKDGADGKDGSQGPAGATGKDGVDGASGAPGAPGATGPSGADGSMGATGAAGATGSTGAQGVAGASGTNVQALDGSGTFIGYVWQMITRTFYVQAAGQRFKLDADTGTITASWRIYDGANCTGNARLMTSDTWSNVYTTTSTTFIQTTGIDLGFTGFTVLSSDHGSGCSGWGGAQPQSPWRTYAFVAASFPVPYPVAGFQIAN